MTRIWYRVDPDDRIVAIGGEWDRFAASNDAGHLREELVLGKTLADFVTEPTTREIYEAVLRRCRAGGEPITFPFRCDAPDCRRYMTMTVSNFEGSGVKFDSRMDREERREHCAVLDASSPRGDRFVSVCSWCKRFKLPDGRWAEVETAIAELKLFDSDLQPRLTHGICSDCARAMRERLARRD